MFKIDRAEFQRALQYRPPIEYFCRKMGAENLSVNPRIKLKQNEYAVND